MHDLCVFCTFSTFAQKIFKEWGCNFTWSFGKVMRIKSLKMVFVARMIRHKLCIIYAFFDFFLFKNHFWPKTVFLLLRGIWQPGVHCIVVLLLCLLKPYLFSWYRGNVTQCLVKLVMSVECDCIIHRKPIVLWTFYSNVVHSKSVAHQAILFDSLYCFDFYHTPLSLYMIIYWAHASVVIYFVSTDFPHKNIVPNNSNKHSYGCLLSRIIPAIILLDPLNSEVGPMNWPLSVLSSVRLSIICWTFPSSVWCLPFLQNDSKYL